jgi:hypothetical protein
MKVSQDCFLSGSSRKECTYSPYLPEPSYNLTENNRASSNPSLTKVERRKIEEINQFGL